MSKQSKKTDYAQIAKENTVNAEAQIEAIVEAKSVEEQIAEAVATAIAEDREAQKNRVSTRHSRIRAFVALLKTQDEKKQYVRYTVRTMSDAVRTREAHLSVDTHIYIARWVRVLTALDVLDVQSDDTFALKQ